MICKKCGAQIADTAKFCNRCGEVVGETAVSKKINKKVSEKVVSKKTNKKAGKKPIVISVVALSLIMVLIIAGPMVIKSIKPKNNNLPTMTQGEGSLGQRINLIYEYNESDMTATVTGIGGLEVVIPSKVEVNGKVYTVKSIGEKAFLGCDNLQSVTISDGVTSIGDRAFDTCKALESITIPNGITSIGRSAFADCDSLQSITIPDSVTSIGDLAFWSCNNLKSIDVPTDLSGNRIFSGCHKLSVEDIPENLR